jgi:hypothetical protein
VLNSTVHLSKIQLERVQRRLPQWLPPENLQHHLEEEVLVNLSLHLEEHLFELSQFITLTQFNPPTNKQT